MCCFTRKYFCHSILIQICLIVMLTVIGKCKSDLINNNTIHNYSDKEFEFDDVSSHLLTEPDVTEENFDELAKLLLKTDVATKIEKNFCANKTSEGYYSDVHSECRVYHICKIENDLVDIKGGKIGPIMSTETFLCPVGSRFDMKERECKSRSTVKCKFEFVSLEQTNDDSKLNRQPKYLKQNLNTNNNEIRDRLKYIDYERKKRKPGSCYRCCVPYPKPSNNHYTTKRPRPTNSWVPRPTRYTTTRRPSYTWTPYPASWIPTRSTLNYYPIYVPAYTTSRPSNVAVIDAIRQSDDKRRHGSLNSKRNSVIDDSTYHSRYKKKQSQNGLSPASQLYLKYKRHPPGNEDFVIVENNQRPVQVIDAVKRNP